MKSFILLLLLALFHLDFVESRGLKKHHHLTKNHSAPKHLSSAKGSVHKYSLLSKSRKNRARKLEEESSSDYAFAYLGSQSDISEETIEVPLLGVLPLPVKGFQLAPARQMHSKRKFKTNQYHDQFTVMQFNILAAGLSTDFDSHVAFEEEGAVTDWENRKEHVFAEIARYFPDLVGLEEMDVMDDLQEEFADDFEIHRHLRKKKKDGPTIMFRKTHFALVHKIDLKLLDVKGKPMTQVALILLLRDKRLTGHFVIAVCAHLKSDKNDGGEDARFRQVVQIQEAVEGLKAKVVKKKNPVRLGIVMMMDLNGDSTGYFEVVKKKQVTQEVYLEYQRRLAIGDVGIVRPFAYHELLYSDLADDLQLESAYRVADPPSGLIMSKDPVLQAKCEDLEASDDEYFTRTIDCLPSKEPAWTTSKSRNDKRVTMAIDYIIFNKDALVPLKVARIPNQDDMFDDDRFTSHPDLYKGLPSWTYPSDHISLVANMAYKN